MNKNSILTNIGMRHMRAASTIARLRSFTAAADELGVAVSALSETIRQIEEDTGVVLFDRSQRPINVTEHGERFVQAAVVILAQFDTAVREMRNIGGLARGRVRISAAPSMLSRLVIPTISRFQRQHKNIEIVIHHENADLVSQKVLGGEVEIGIHERHLDGRGLHHRRIATDFYGIACSTDHPLARRKQVTYADLQGEPFISLTGETGIRKTLEAHGFPASTYDGALATSSTIALMWMVSCNIGIAVLPRFASEIPLPEGVQFVPFADPTLKREICIITKDPKSLGPAARAFIQMMDEYGSYA